jgi:hypothetical protein
LILSLLLTTSAHAVGIGSTAGLGTGGLFVFDGDFFGLGSSLGFAPTLDIHANPVLIQIHVLEFTEALIDAEDIYLGANVLFAAHEAPLAGPWLGVVEPGFGIDLYAANDTAVAITGQCRLGAQVQEAAGLGVYVVPEVGIGITDGDADWIAGGTLQVSAWFGG